MKERKISIAATVNVISVSGKKTSIYRVWEKDMDARMAAELLKNGSVHVKDLYSRKKDQYLKQICIWKPMKTESDFHLSFPERKTTKKNKKK